MTESLELKAGDTSKLSIGGKTLLIEPIPYGRMKQLMKIVFQAMDQMAKMKDGSDAFTVLPALVEEHMPVIMPLLFTKKKHPFLNVTWIEENVTYLHMKEIYTKVIMVNGLKDFLGRLGAPTMIAKTPQPEETVVVPLKTEIPAPVEAEASGAAS